MNRYNGLKEDILKVNGAFERIFTATGDFPGVSGDSFSGWRKICGGIQRQISEDQVRVAVVGAIKSGKSTFVNSLFQHDYLKRGAGVVTSIVTRIHCGDRLKAILCFKSWDEVNLEIEHALSLIPGMEMEEGSRFDLRKRADRERLGAVLQELTTDQLIQNDARNINSVLLSSYLKGYESVKDIVGPETVVKEYEDGDFNEHRKFSGDEVLAVYLSDIQIDIRSDLWDDSIEIADCQGSDSPNPLHLAMIQDYLLRTNLIVYVVSSRSGLRRADIRFLTMIREMGIMDNMLFVVNCDFSEHESGEELEGLVAKVREELSLIRKKPEVYTLSALYNLFKASGRESLSRRDSLRLEQWEMDGAFTSFSDSETERFREAINGKLIGERNALLLKNHVERHAVIAAGLGRWAAVNRDILTRDARSAEKVVDGIRLHSDRMEQVRSMIRSTLDGAVKQVRQDLSRKLDAFLEGRNGSVTEEIREFIERYAVSCEKYIREPADDKEFTSAVYMTYQDFKQALDIWLAESVSPRIFKFAGEAEEELAESLETITRPYTVIVEEALEEYMETATGFGLSFDGGERVAIAVPEPEEIKRVNRIDFPAVSSVMTYSLKIKTEAVVRFGAYSIINLVKRILRKESRDKKSLQVLALKHTVARMKGEAARTMATHFQEYKQSIKDNYFFRFIDAAADAVYQARVEAFEAYITDLSKVTGQIAEKKEDKERLLAFLTAMDQELAGLKNQIYEIKEKI